MTGETDRAGCKAWCGTRRKGGAVHNDGHSTWSYSFDTNEVVERWCSDPCHLAKLPPLPVSAKAAPKVEHPMREAGQRWMAADGRELTLSAEYPLSNQPDAWIDTAGRLWWSWDTMTLLSPAPVAKPADPVQEAKERWAKRNGQPVPAKPPVAQGAKACEVCRKPGPTVAKRDPPLLLYCDPCYLSREAFINGGNTTNVLRNPAIPERLTKAQLASDWTWDCLPEAGR